MPPALGQCVLNFCYFPAAFCPRFGRAYDVWLSVHPDFSLPSGSLSAERLCFSLLGLYFVPLWLGVFCREGTCHCCSDTSRQGLLNYPHPLKIEIHSPTVLRHIFIRVYSELSSSYPSLLITGPNLWFAQAFRKIHFFHTGAVGISVLWDQRCHPVQVLGDGERVHGSLTQFFLSLDLPFPKEYKNTSFTYPLTKNWPQRRGWRGKFGYTLKCRKSQGDRKNSREMKRWKEGAFLLWRD